ncbi:MAG: T9SS type A sorting domain-containing protein, partial [Bacteroidia bacterium]|nr:T9SS type A sorting domain-containing protein [Bacteroidia bacterium]
QKPIDLTSFAKGVYYVKITSENKKYTQKISIL